MDMSLKNNKPCLSNSAISCKECWDREIHEQWPKDNPHISDGIKEATEVFRNIATGAKFAGAACENLAEGAKKMLGSIKDSGDRTEFATGAVRDMREGKGRCDLMPLEVVAYLYPGNQMNIFHEIKSFQKTNNTTYLYGALCKFADEAYNRNVTTMFLEVAKHFEEGAKKYGENNWQKGIPVKCYIDSAIRHYLKWLRGDKDEPHDRAFVWNIMCCIWEVDYHKEDSHAD